MRSTEFRLTNLLGKGERSEAHFIIQNHKEHGHALLMVRSFVDGMLVSRETAFWETVFWASFGIIIIMLGLSEPIKVDIREEQGKPGANRSGGSFSCR